MNEAQARKPEVSPENRHCCSWVDGMSGHLARLFPHHTRPWHHSHEEAELNLVVRGTGAYILEARGRYELRPQTLIWLMPRQVHRIVPGRDLELWSLVFRPDLLTPAWQMQLADQPATIVSSQEAIGLDHLFIDIIQDSDDPAVFNPAVEYAIMRAIRASRDRPPASLKSMHPAVARALEIMRGDNADQSLASLAAAAGIAPHYLSRLMVEHTGRNFLDWRNRIRLDRFMALYRPGANLLSLAMDAGFGSYTRFHATFNELVGESPKEWARRAATDATARVPDNAAPVAGFSESDRRLVSSRQRWAILVPLASPALRAVVGDNFLCRLIEATPTDREPRWLALERLTDPQSPDERDRLAHTLRTQDSALAEQYGRMLNSWDVHAYLERAGQAIADDVSGAPEADFGCMIASLLTLMLTLNHRRPVTVAQLYLVRRQVWGALAARAAVDPGTIRQAYLAMVSHFTVVHQAGLAARAAKDPVVLSELLAMFSDWTIRLFGDDVYAYELGTDGLRRCSDASQVTDLLVPHGARGNKIRASEGFGEPPNRSVVRA